MRSLDDLRGRAAAAGDRAQTCVHTTLLSSSNCLEGGEEGGRGRIETNAPELCFTLTHTDNRGKG